MLYFLNTGSFSLIARDLNISLFSLLLFAPIEIFLLEDHPLLQVVGSPSHGHGLLLETAPFFRKVNPSFSEKPTLPPLK